MSSLSATRIVLDGRANRVPEGLLFNEHWPAYWITAPDRGSASFVSAYRLKFSLGEKARIRIHTTADQRYELYLNGALIGLGPERGTPLHWCYESYELALEKGDHVLAAKVWTLDLNTGQAPAAQLTVSPGFLLQAEEPFADSLSTGLASWDCKSLAGYRFVPPLSWARFAGGSVEIDGNFFDWGFASGLDGGWQIASKRVQASSRLNVWGEFSGNPQLEPARLPPMLTILRQIGRVRSIDEAVDTSGVISELTPSEETIAWQQLLSGTCSLTIAANTRRRVIIDLEDYYCGYAELVSSGGIAARIQLHWAEAAYEREQESDDGLKGHRDQLAGKKFKGRGDCFITDGGDQRHFRGLWWMAGRYIEVCIETKDQPLVIELLAVRETRYPLEQEGSLAVANEKFQQLIPVMWRTLQVCAHETYMDCPYYEQLMYVGDTRVQALVTYVMSRDDRLPRKAIEMFAHSLEPQGLTQARYPSAVVQIIPQFSLFWIGMLHDFALWRGDRDFIRAQMPAARAVIERFISSIQLDAFLILPKGWDWVDWPLQWSNGTPPTGEDGVSAINNWQFLMVVTLAIELEKWLEEPELAERLRGIRAKLLKKCLAAFWVEERGLFADTIERNSFSEHAQCYAILTGLLPQEKLDRLRTSLLSETGLTEATFYFQHYLFEAWRVLGRADRIIPRMEQWHGMMIQQGAKTIFERLDPTRSDCHAWGSHPIFHGCASIAGIRPATFGFDEIVISPQLGALDTVDARVMHPNGGEIVAAFRRQGETVIGTITLPEPIRGVLHYRETSIELHPGTQILELKCLQD